MNQEELLQASSRMALAGMLHDLGKFTERAKITIPAEKEHIHQQLYCPLRQAGDSQWHTHKHAAYTALGVDLIEQHAPKLVGENMFPFASWKSIDSDDSLINAAAGHHKPNSYLQWIIATADRVASGFEREEFEQYNKSEDKNHYQSRQLTLFEQINLHVKNQQDLQYRYALKPLSPQTLFPIAAKGYEPEDNTQAQQEYHQLWDNFCAGLTKIPESHKQQLPLWLDHFDSLWQTYTHSIPSATAFGIKPDVSLYDHSKAVTALAVALWRYDYETEIDPHHAIKQMRSRADWDDAKLLLIQSDFFGIQNFIFAQGGDSNKQAAKLLRGRSFYVSLISECAALAILDELALPSTSQIINAAGKFLIVAPNTEATKTKLSALKHRFNQWFLEQSYGESGLGIAWEAASCNDFVNTRKDSRFQGLMEKLHKGLERAKYQHFDLCSSTASPAVFADYLDSLDNQQGICKVNDKAPAATKGYSELANDQINIGQFLVKNKRLIISRQALTGLKQLQIPLFGYTVHFTAEEDKSGKFGAEVKNNNIRRVFDFSPAKQEINATLWNGYARRNISGYVARFTKTDHDTPEKYRHCDKDDNVLDSVKPLDYIACEDKWFDAQKNSWIGISALGILKGDIDDLGAIFQTGLKQPTFAKMAALSRQVNNFFSVYLPWLCQTKYPDSYIVFAGGDDFFLIGPWQQQIELATTLRDEFKRYVAHNAQIHFSVGLSITKAGLPIHQIAQMSEHALEQAKAYQPKNDNETRKNAICCFNQTVSWAQFASLWTSKQRLQQLSVDYQLSTAYLYGLLSLTQMAGDNSKPENALWRSKFYYRTQRMVMMDRKLDPQQKQQLAKQLIMDIGEQGIQQFKAHYLIPLQAYLYKNRDHSRT